MAMRLLLLFLSSLVLGLNLSQAAAQQRTDKAESKENARLQRSKNMLDSLRRVSLKNNTGKLLASKASKTETPQGSGKNDNGEDKANKKTKTADKTSTDKTSQTTSDTAPKSAQATGKTRVGKAGVDKSNPPQKQPEPSHDKQEQKNAETGTKSTPTADQAKGADKLASRGSKAKSDKGTKEQSRDKQDKPQAKPERSKTKTAKNLQSSTGSERGKESGSQKTKEDKKKKASSTASPKKKVSLMSAIQTTNKLLKVRGSNRYNAIGRKSKKDSHTIEGDLDEKGNSSENRIFDVGRKLSSRKSTISRVYSPFQGNKLAKQSISLFLESSFGAGGSLSKFQDRVSIKRPTLTLTQFSKGYIPMRLGFGMYTNERIISVALDYTYNYSFGAQSFRSENQETITSNLHSITGFVESPVTDLHEITINANYFFYQKLTEGVDLIKLYTGIEAGTALADVASKYSVRSANRYRVDGGYAFTDFKKKYATITYLKGGLKFGILLRVNHKIHLLSDLAFSYYYPIQKQIKYQLTTKKLNPTQAAALLEAQLPLQADRDALGKQNWTNSLKPSMQLSWQLGMRYILPH